MYILVISTNMSFRKVCIDNLVNRGHVAVGVPSFTEGQNLLQKAMPDAIVICPHTESAEPEVQKIRSHYRLKSTPILLISPDRSHQEIMSNWKVSAHAVYPVDAHRFVDALMPLLAY
jgi:hypothetical protein